MKEHSEENAGSQKANGEKNQCKCFLFNVLICHLMQKSSL